VFGFPSLECGFGCRVALNEGAVVSKLTRFAWLVIAVALTAVVAAGSAPARAKKGMVISASSIASQIGADVLKEGGNAVDAAVATAFALAVTHPVAGNIGGGGFIVYRSASGEADAYDFRETAPSGSSPTMFTQEGKYDFDRHHNSYVSIGVPGTVAGLHMAWKDHGTLSWKRLVAPGMTLARQGFPVSIALAASLGGILEDMRPFPGSLAQFSRNGVPYQAGEILKQPDLASTLERIATAGPAGFYDGETAALLERALSAHGGLITRQDLRAYRAVKRVPVRGTYRGYEILSMPAPSSGGTALVEMLNVLEGYDLKTNGYGSAQNIHLIVEAMRRAFADRAQYLGDPEFNRDMPTGRLTSKEYAAGLRRTIDQTRASQSSPTTFSWPAESAETTHVSVVDEARNAVALTYTLEFAYGSRIVAPGTGFLLNNEMGDFNASPGLTTVDGLIGTSPNVAEPHKRMLSSMAPTIVARDGHLVMVTGSPGSRTIINTVLETILNVVDFGMNAQEAVDAGRFHHQWLPDQVSYEPFAFSPDTLALLEAKGHTLRQSGSQGVAEVIVNNVADGMLEGGIDRRQPDGGAATK
jgi:gamma-glutamyltranspeptidase/glutathione hydrolase